MSSERAASTTDKYERVERPAEEPAKPNEVRVTGKGKPRAYTTYAAGLLRDEEKNISSVVIRGMGRAISIAVTVAEMLKKEIPGLHQIVHLGSNTLVDEWRPLEDGLKVVETKRTVSFITITLSKETLNEGDVGYQAPKVVSEEAGVEVVKSADKSGEDSKAPRKKNRRNKKKKSGTKSSEVPPRFNAEEEPSVGADGVEEVIAEGE